MRRRPSADRPPVGRTRRRLLRRRARQLEASLAQTVKPADRTILRAPAASCDHSRPVPPSRHISIIIRSHTDRTGRHVDSGRDKSPATRAPSVVSVNKQLLELISPRPHGRRFGNASRPNTTKQVRIPTRHIECGRASTEGHDECDRRRNVVAD